MLESKCLFAHAPAAVIRFSGEDHLDFLQGQGTADLRGEFGLACYDLWLDHRGNIHGDGFILHEGEQSTLLVSYATPEEVLMAKFDRHIIADDVEMEPCTREYRLLSVPPQSVEEFLAEAGLERPGHGRILYAGPALGFWGRRLGPGTLDILFSGEGAFSIPAGWSDSPGLAAAEQLRIRGGIPMIPTDLDDGGMNPVEAGILSPVSFTKGCYLGQEVVARVHRLGRSPRRMVRFSGTGSAPSTPMKLEAGGQQVGELRSVVTFPDTFEGVGWLKNKIEDGIIDAGDITLRAESLPPS